MSYKRTSSIPISEGGSSVVTMTTAYAPICAGTTATGSLQVASSGMSNSGYLLTSTGSSSLPTWQSFSGTTSITGDTGGALSGTSFTFSGGTTGLSFGGSGTTETLTFAGITANGGTVSLATDATASTINIGTGAGVKTSRFGSTNTTSTTTLNGGTGGVQIAGSFLNLPTTTSTAGILKINNLNMFQSYWANFNTNTFMGQGGYIGQSTQFDNNTAVGKNSLKSVNNTAAWTNTCIGTNSGTAITSGKRNAMFGWGSGSTVSTGDQNSHVGYNAGSSSGAATANTVYINNVGANESNVMRLGAATGTGSQELNKTFIHGIRGITTVNANAIAVLIDSAGQLGTVSSSIRYKENVIDMTDFSSLVLNLRPVVFDFINKPNNKKCVGLIAEEVEKTIPSLVAYDQDLQPESVKYQDISILLLNELLRLLKRIEYLESIV